MSQVGAEWSRDGAWYWRTDARGLIRPITRDEFFDAMQRAARLPEREEANPTVMGNHDTRIHPAQVAPSRSVSPDRKEPA